MKRTSFFSIVALLLFILLPTTSLALTKQRLIMNKNQVALMNGHMTTLTTRGNIPHDPTGTECIKFQKKYPKINCVSYEIVKSDGSYAIVIRTEASMQSLIAKTIYLYNLDKKVFSDITDEMNRLFHLNSFGNYVFRMEGDALYLKVWASGSAESHMRENGYIPPEECNDGAPGQCYSLEKKIGLHETTWLTLLKKFKIIK